jgi:hypothetical protein
MRFTTVLVVFVSAVMAAPLANPEPVPDASLDNIINPEACCA